jgi:hypothetical protein
VELTEVDADLGDVDAAASSANACCTAWRTVSGWSPTCTAMRAPLSG